MYSTFFDDLFDLNREMNRIFNSVGVGYTGRKTWPETNIYENKDEYILVSKVPGVEKGDIDITLKDNSLTLKGERKRATDDHSKLHKEECFTGKFERNFMLNEKVDQENIKAENENGLLMIKLPKSPEVKPRRIEIN